VGGGVSVSVGGAGVGLGGIGVSVLVDGRSVNVAVGGSGVGGSTGGVVSCAKTAGLRINNRNAINNAIRRIKSHFHSPH